MRTGDLISGRYRLEALLDAVDTDDCWLVMEYLPAENLDTILAAHGPRHDRSH